MRVDTLILMPILGITLYSLIAINGQIENYSSYNFIDCSLNPFGYSVRGEFSQCGWNSFDLFLIIFCFVSNLIICLLAYFISRKIKILMVIIGEFSFGVSIYLYRHCYAAHEYCQKHILPTMREKNLLIQCKDDAYYVIIGMLFLLSLLVVFFAVCYIITDENGVALCDIDFGVSANHQSSDPYAKDVRKKEEIDHKKDE